MTAAERRGLDLSSAPEDVQALLNRLMHLEDERDRMRRLFNRLEAAVSHHKRSDHWKEEVDVALYRARDKILRDYAEGKG